MRSDRDEDAASTADHADWPVEATAVDAQPDAWGVEEPTLTDGWGTPGIATEPEVLDVLIEADPDEEGASLSRYWIAGGIASLLVHVWFFSSLSSMTIADREPIYSAPIESRLPEDVVEPEEIQTVELELANPDEEEHEQQLALNAKSVGQLLAEEPVTAAEPPPQPTELVIAEAAAVAIDIPEGLELDDVLVVPGTTGEGLIQLDAALDRITYEIAANMKEHKVLVVWLLDASGSLKEQRQQVSKRLRRIYTELDALAEAGEIPNADQPILTGVVAFGQETKFITPAPTARLDDIVTAFEKVPTDETGVENTFNAVKMVNQRWSDQRVSQGRRILTMVVTDEAGDDFGNLNPAIGVVNRLGGKVYVIGPPAVFGKRQGFVPYVAPEDGKTYQLPVDIGPETPLLGENVQLPFWFNGPQYDNLSSGLGPYGLARIVHETGGVFFMTNMTTSSGLAPTGSYSSAPMKLFQPDYRFGTPEDYLRDLQKHPLRRAVIAAGQLSLKYKARGTPPLELRVNQGNYLQNLAEAQKVVAESTLMIENILQAFPPSLEAEYAKEESPRWRMAYNLSLGRLLAQRVRCYEYNYACAHLKLMGAGEVASKSNHWIFRPDKSLNYYAGAKKQLAQAEMLLQRCVDEAPGTPWGMMASRELQFPLGIKIIEQYDPPPPPPRQNANPVATKPRPVLLLADDRKRGPTPKPAPPPPPPKLPKL